MTIGFSGWGRVSRGIDHAATTLKNDTFIHLQTRSDDATAEDGGCMDLDAVSSLDGCLNFSTNNNDSRVDLALDFCALADDQGIGSINLSFEAATNSDGALKGELPLKFTSLVEDSANGSGGGGRDERRIFLKHDSLLHEGDQSIKLFAV